MGGAMLRRMGRKGLGQGLLAVALGVLFAAGPQALAEEPRKAPQKKPAQKVEVPKIDLGGLGGIPNADGVQKKRSDASAELSPKVTGSEVEYRVERVVHAQGFTRSVEGHVPVGEALEAIRLHGRPPVTQAFTTMIRVKATANVNASIDVAILDPRGDTALSGSGNLSFANAKTGEAEWLIDWTPTPRPHAGEYKVLVRIAGRPMGTWPLRVLPE